MPILSTASTISLISTFKERLVKNCDKVISEVLFFLDNGLPDYLNSIKGKFEQTKTFLYRQETVNFYDVFFAVSLQNSGGAKAIENCEELFEQQRFVSIIGSAGSGKTMLMKHFFLQSIKSAFGIPLFIELRSLNDFKGSFTDFIYEVILQSKLSPDQRILERLLESGAFVIMLDGYDEIYSTHKQYLTNDIERFIDRYTKNHFIISSRPSSGIESLSRFNNYQVNPLSKKQINEFVEVVLHGSEDIELAKNIKQTIAKPENKEYSHLLSSPLLLSMFILTFSKNPELPKTKSKFYWNVFDTLASKHDVFTKRGGYQHERKSGLHNEDFELILQCLAFISLSEGMLNFDSEYLNKTLQKIKEKLKMSYDTSLVIEDLNVAISILVVDGIEYKFPHKSIQEYFAVMFMKSQPVQAKEGFYKKAFKRIAERTNGSMNLWNLAMEVDRNDFSRLFILPLIEEFTSQFAGLEGIMSLKRLYEIYNIREVFECLVDAQFEFGGGESYASTLSIYLNLFAFLGLDKEFLMNLITQGFYANRAAFTAYMDTVADDDYNWQVYTNSDGMEEASHSFPVLYHWSAALEQLLLDSGTVERFEQFFSQIQQSRQRIEKELLDERESSASFFDF
ncbi:NACHT domain-containing protein [Pedobacter agri]|uniref:NACHT domain-containing protein n=1 Tax=Pedobacter agri TaxID=454586 RepID=UPI0029316344|nr:NACHT domain-containing protein [Pedobacter agri]